MTLVANNNTFIKIIRESDPDKSCLINVYSYPEIKLVATYDGKNEKLLKI